MFVIRGPHTGDNPDRLAALRIARITRKRPIIGRKADVRGGRRADNRLGPNWGRSQLSLLPILAGPQPVEMFEFTLGVDRHTCFVANYLATGIKGVCYEAHDHSGLAIAKCFAR